MRLGVLDVGSNTVHLLVVDAHAGACPLPAAKVKSELRLAQLVGRDGALSKAGAERLVTAVHKAAVAADDLGVEDLVAFATSAVREATNVDAVLDRVRTETGVDLQVLSGHDEARMTFLAVRRWFGWSAGRLLVLDIGGGSLEIASGPDEEPAVAISLPLGAGRLTRDWLPGDPPRPSAVRELRRHVRKELAGPGREVAREGAPDRVVGTSKTFRSLARIAGAAPYAAGPYARRTLRDSDLRAMPDKLSTMRSARRSALPGVSAERAGQLPAGAVVAAAAMEAFDVDELELCPWALREGVILRRMDWLGGT